MSRIDEARGAFKEKDLDKAQEAHTKEWIETEPWHDVTRGRYIGDVIYGASDGIVTTFAIVAGATGALFSSTIILILGFANLIADGFSMAAGNYLGAKSELEYFKKEKEREGWEVEHFPSAEREEIRQIFRKKGLASHLADKLSAIISTSKKAWIDFMMTEELGLISNEDVSPLKSALATFIAFIVAGFMPLLFFILSYAVTITNTFTLSVVTTAVSLFIVGALRVKITGGKLLKSGFEMLLVGGAAATVAYLVGNGMRALIG